MCYRAGVAVERVYARPGLSVPDLEGAVCRAGNYHLWRRVVEVAAMLLTVKMMVTMTFRCTAMTLVCSRCWPSDCSRPRQCDPPGSSDTCPSWQTRPGGHVSDGLGAEIEDGGAREVCNNQLNWLPK